MSVHAKGDRWAVRYREGDRNRSRTFTRKRDAVAYDAEVQRRRQLGPVAVTMLDAGAMTLDAYVADHWAPGHLAHLAPKTRAGYASLYGTHLAPFVGGEALRDLTADRIAKWQAERLRAGAGTEAIRKANTLLGNVLQRAVESGRIPSNPQRLVRKPKPIRSDEVRPLAPREVEAMRTDLLDTSPVVVAAAQPGQRARRAHEVAARDPLVALRDATLVSILAYAGLRPGEALDLRWGNVQARTLVVTASKTLQRRSVKLLAALSRDLAAWRLASPSTADADLVFPGHAGDRWTQEAYRSWARRTFARAAKAAGRPDATPYTLRHSFASLLFHEGRSVIYVARQLGHSAAMTLGVYGHVMEELDGTPNLAAEDAIRAARGEPVPSEFPEGRVPPLKAVRD